MAGVLERERGREREGEREGGREREGERERERDAVCHYFTVFQVELEDLRMKLNSVRESVRENFLAKERAEAERLRLLEEAQSPMGGRDSKSNKKGKKKK